MVTFILTSLGLFYGFVFYAGALQAWDRALIGQKIILAPPLVFFGLLDVVFNVTFGTIMFLELPSFHLITFSKRCEFHMADNNWRGSIAGAYCFLLNTFIPDHCQK
jgi:hypothetical protein